MPTQITDFLRGVSAFMLAAVLTFSVIYPKISVVVMDLIPSIQSVVLCTGDGLVVINIDSNGNPVEETELIAEHCVVGEGAPEITEAPQFWIRLAQSYQSRFNATPNANADMERLLRKLPPRAPPVLT